jgi:hypothetical protein
VLIVLALRSGHALPPQENSWYLFLLGWANCRIIVKLRGLDKLKIFNDLIGNRTRDLPACGRKLKFGNMFLFIICNRLRHSCTQKCFVLLNSNKMHGDNNHASKCFVIHKLHGTDISDGVHRFLTYSPCLIYFMKCSYDWAVGQWILLKERLFCIESVCPQLFIEYLLFYPLM